MLAKESGVSTIEEKHELPGYMCVCVYIYVYVYVCVCVCIYIYIYIYIYISDEKKNTEICKTLYCAGDSLRRFYISVVTGDQR
jgi:hypothetical protein